MLSAVSAPGVQLYYVERGVFGTDILSPFTGSLFKKHIFPSTQRTAGFGVQLIPFLPRSAFSSLLCHFKAAIERALLKLCKAPLVR